MYFGIFIKLTYLSQIQRLIDCAGGRRKPVRVSVAAGKATHFGGGQPIADYAKS